MSSRPISILLPLLLCGYAAGAGDDSPAFRPPLRPKVEDAWRPVPAAQAGGLLGERLKAWRDHRLWRVGEDPYLLSGFTSRPGVHEYQGEHLGKWLHSATLAYESTRDGRLLDRMREVVRGLLSAQETNGYLGTYALADRFYAPLTPKQRISWDVWTHRYNLYGLLVYEGFHPDEAVVEACARMGDLLRQTFGPAGRPITEIGTRHGMSSATVLESIMMLYERTGEGRFLDFAQHLVETCERTAGFRLLNAMLSGEDVSGPGDGKAYQLMGMLLGYLEVYRHTGDSRYLNAAVHGWENIRAGHLYETGGPWSHRSRPIQNAECFAEPRFYQPTRVVETCATTTWIQLCLRLHRLTGQARYGSEAERAVLNHLLGAQAPNGEDWAYFTAPNCA